MALIVEDGTGLSTAQSYVSVADCTTYCAAKGNTSWAAAASDALREAALVRATAALDGLYASRWPGFRYTEDQALAWPRSYAYDVDGYCLDATVPQALKNATCEAAILELAESGVLSKKGEAGLRSLTIGPISKTWAGSSAPGATAYPAIRNALARIVKAGGGNIAIGGR